MKRIFEYTDYRQFLRDFYEGRKKTAEKFSLHRFALMAGFHSAGFLKMILDGKRNLSHESIRKMAEALRFNKDETYYFTHLVLLNQARDSDEKKFHAEMLLRSRSYRKLHPLKEAQFEFYTRWYGPALQQLVATKDFQEDPHWIASALQPSITPREASATLELLLKLGLIVRDAQGKLEVSNKALTTGDQVDSMSVSEFHRQMLERASESIDRFTPTERDISSLTFHTGPKTYGQVKELVQKFRKEILAILVASPEAASDAFELNFQLFPLSRSAKAKAPGRKSK